MKKTSNLIFVVLIFELGFKLIASRYIPLGQLGCKMENIDHNYNINEYFCRCYDGKDYSYGLNCDNLFRNPCLNSTAQHQRAHSSIPEKYFIHCTNSIPHLFKCPANLNWNDDLKTCHRSNGKRRRINLEKPIVSERLISSSSQLNNQNQESSLNDLVSKERLETQNQNIYSNLINQFTSNNNQLEQIDKSNYQNSQEIVNIPKNEIISTTTSQMNVNTEYYTQANLVSKQDSSSMNSQDLNQNVQNQNQIDTNLHTSDSNSYYSSSTTQETVTDLNVNDIQQIETSPEQNELNYYQTNGNSDFNIHNEIHSEKEDQFVSNHLYSYNDKSTNNHEQTSITTEHINQNHELNPYNMETNQVLHTSDSNTQQQESDQQNNLEIEQEQQQQQDYLSYQSNSFHENLNTVSHHNQNEQLIPNESHSMTNHQNNLESLSHHIQFDSQNLHESKLDNPQVQLIIKKNNNNFQTAEYEQNNNLDLNNYNNDNINSNDMQEINNNLNQAVESNQAVSTNSNSAGFNYMHTYYGINNLNNHYNDLTNTNLNNQIKSQDLNAFNPERDRIEMNLKNTATQSDLNQYSNTVNDMTTTQASLVKPEMSNLNNLQSNLQQQSTNLGTSFIETLTSQSNNKTSACDCEHSSNRLEKILRLSDIKFDPVSSQLIIKNPFANLVANKTLNIQLKIQLQ